MEIAIIGTGNVGGNLGKALAAKGHSITFGVRDPSSDKVKALLAEAGANSWAASVADAVASADVIAIATPWAAVADVVNQGGSWAGKIIIDATNRFSPSLTSAAEDLATMASGARVVKAFNTIGAEHLLKPNLSGEIASMFICGDDPEAKQVIGALVEDLGFDLVDAGGLGNAKMVEMLAQLWVTLMRAGSGREIAFRLVR